MIEKENEMEFTQEINNRKALILIVDDIPKNLQILSNILNIEGYQISFASNGQQALSVVHSTMPDLILLDIMMPEMDGFEFARIIKSDEKTKEIPIIFLTGKAETEDIVKGFQYGAIDYITKPFNPTELLTRVKTHLELKLTKDRMISYTEKLKAYQLELKQVIASKDKFFSIIAHDLRGPFSGFIGLSELLKNQYENFQKEEIVNIGISLNKTAKNLFSLLENLLEWSSTQMGRIDYHPISFDFSEIVYKNIELYRATANEKNIELISEITKNTLVFADTNMVKTILRNLISNALKFTENGSVCISMISENDNFYTFKIEDSGMGMSNDLMSKLFQIEYKISTQGTKNETGTGLGLILCKELIEINKGIIKVESELGKGTKFIFTLPKSKYF